MMRILSFRWIAWALAAGTSALALAELPPRDLMVELRHVSERPSKTYGSSTSDVDAGYKPQTLMVRNGEKATVRFNTSTPVEWTQRVESSTTSIGSINPASPGLQQGSGAAVTKALQWMDAGQSVSITPRWPGGKRPVVVELEMRNASVNHGPADALPGQGRSEVNTTITVALGEWITVARTGDGVPSGSYRNNESGSAPQLVQLRVSVP